LKYTVVINGKPQGPFNLAQLKFLGIKPETFIKRTGMDDYKEAHEFEELRVIFGFSYQQTAPQYFASFDQRLLASAIDYFLIVLVFVFIALAVHLFLNDKQITLATIISLAIATPIVKLIYGTVAEASTTQATIGKKLMDIKVGDLLGNRLTFAQSFMRNIAKAISVLPFFFGYLYLFLNKKQQCFHDVVAGTLVVKQRLL
jgi:uncharacterized RDD family membrane protein YckC